MHPFSDTQRLFVICQADGLLSHSSLTQIWNIRFQILNFTFGPNCVQEILEGFAAEALAQLQTIRNVPHIVRRSTKNIPATTEAQSGIE